MGDAVLATVLALVASAVVVSVAFAVTDTTSSTDIPYQSMWLWASLNPGTTVRPPRSMIRAAERSTGWCAGAVA